MKHVESVQNQAWTHHSKDTMSNRQLSVPTNNRDGLHVSARAPAVLTGCLHNSFASPLNSKQPLLLHACMSHDWQVTFDKACVAVCCTLTHLTSGQVHT